MLLLITRFHYNILTLQTLFIHNTIMHQNLTWLVTQIIAQSIVGYLKDKIIWS